MHPHRRGHSLSSIGIGIRMGRRKHDDDLALFNDMDSAGNGNGNGFPQLKVPRGRGCEDLLRADGDKNDYEWLLTPPETPLLLSMETKDRTAGFSQGVSPMVHAANALKSSRLSNPHTDSSSKMIRGSLTSRQMMSSGMNSSMNIASGARSSMVASTGPTSSRSSTPARSRGVSPSATSVPRSTVTVTASGRPSTPTSTRTTSRPSTPTSRCTVPASSPSSRPSTPTSRSTMPTPRPTMTTSKSLSRPSTPTRQQSTPTTLYHGTCVPPTRSFPASNISSMLSRNPPRPSPSPSPPLVLPGFSLDAPPNLRTTMHDRPISAARSRPGAPTSTSTSTSTSSVQRPPTSQVVSRPRGKSCSPIVTRGRVSSDRHGKPTLQPTKPHINGAEVTKSVLLGSKVSETKEHEDQASPTSNSSTSLSRRQVKSTSAPESSGFGRTISKKSLDMALRHMDIRQSAHSNIRPLTNIPTSDLHRIRLGSTKSKASKISESPILTNSSAISDHSTRIAPYPQPGNALDDFQIVRERENVFSPLSQHESVLFRGDELSTNWLHGPTNGGDKFDQALLLERFDESFDAFTVRTDAHSDSLHKRAR